MEEKKATTTRTRKKKVAASSGYTAPGFTVPEGCEKIAYARIEIENWDKGQKLSSDYVYKTTARGWDKNWRQLLTLGYTIHEILHLPEGCQDPREHVSTIK
jgi:hypothetical protein